MALPLAAVFAAVQFYLCKKARGKAAKLLPIFASAACFLAAVFIKGENFLASAVYGFLGWGIFALVVILWILGAAIGMGALAGWIIYLIRHKS